MNTLSISKKLLSAGLKQEQAEAIAQAIDEKNQELASRSETRLLFAGLYIAGVYGFILLNTIISKLG